MAQHPCQPQFCSEVIPLIQQIRTAGCMTRQDQAHLQQAIARSTCLCTPEKLWIRQLEDELQAGTLQLLD